MLHKNSVPTSFQVDQHVPDFVKTDHEKFVQFLVNYYEYLDQNENINDYIRNVISFMDVDVTTEFLLNNFFEELKDLPYLMVADKRLLAQHIIDMYASKGSLDSFRLLFRILFNESINVLYPSEKILRASDGRWSQESFVEIYTVFGDLDLNNTVKEIFFENEFGKFRILPTKIEQITDTVHRIHYDSRKRVYIQNDQLFYMYDANGVKEYVGRIQKSPAKLFIQDGGKFWQIGEIVTIPGTEQDTIARVTRVGPNGEITGIEILEYGSGHAENQISIISPFPNKPVGSGVSITSTLVSFSPLVYEHTIDIFDYMEGFDEGIQGLAIEVGDESYFAEEYAANDYNAVLKFEVTNIAPPTIDSEVPNDDITIQDWLDSRATFVFMYDYIVKEKGFYETDHSIISNSEIRLQDGFYYQLYSYVIQTSRNIDDYKQALSLIHPAGMKYFSELQKEFSYNVAPEIEVTRSVSADRLYFNEVSNVAELATWIMDKNLADVVTNLDVVEKILTKSLSDSSSATDAATKAIDKVIADVQATSDALTRVFDKAIDDAATGADVLTMASTKAVADSMSAVTDSVALTPTKAFSDTSTATHGSASLNTISYMVSMSDYFTSDYILTEKILTIV